MIFHIEEQQPDGSFEPRSYELDFDLLTNDDIGALEEESGWSYKEFTERCARREMRATTAQVWLAKRRVDPTARFGDLVFRLTGMDVEPSNDEIRTAIESLSGDERDAYVAVLTDEQKQGVADLIDDPLPTEAPTL